MADVYSSKRNIIVKRNRFSIKEDISLLQKAILENPFQTPVRWTKIAKTMYELHEKNYSPRAVRDRTNYLLKLFEQQDQIRLRKSGTEQQYEEREKLLQNLLDLQNQTVSNKQLSPNEDESQVSIGQTIEYENDDEPECSLQYDSPFYMPVSPCSPPQAAMSPNRTSGKSKEISFLKEKYRLDSIMKEKELEIKAKHEETAARNAEIEARKVELEFQRFEHEKTKLAHDIAMSEARLEMEKAERETRLRIEERMLETQVQTFQTMQNQSHELFRMFMTAIENIKK